MPDEVLKLLFSEASSKKEKYLLVQDKSEVNDSLKFFRYSKIYVGKGADCVLTDVYNYLSFRRMGDDE